MATKIYGSCNGSSGSKYNVWLEITENSHSIENNTSNITVNFKLKRNDSYSSSAYNLNEDENTATLSVAGSVKRKINLKIDTRNSATVLLASWTGNVAHNDDGSLNVQISGSFSMNGTSLSGGSASGYFKCVTIPRASSLSMAKTSFVPNEFVNSSIAAASTDFSHQVVLSLGSYRKTYNIDAGVRICIFSVGNEWANALPKSKSGVVSVVLKTYNNGNLVGTYTTSIRLNIPGNSDFLPDFNISLTSANNSTVPSTWTSLVVNKSSVTVGITGASYKYGASFASNFAVVNTVKKTTLPAKFGLTKSGEVSIKVRVTDSRGYYKEKTTTLNVADYISPSLILNNVYRCDSAGNPSKTGAYARLYYKMNYSSVNGENSATVKIKYKKGNETSYTTEITSTSSPVLVNGSFQASSSYDFLLSVTDKITTKPFEVRGSIPSSSIPFNIKKGGNGVAFGCYAENDNELTVAYNLNVKGILSTTSLNDSVVMSAGFTLKSIDIKRYDCLGFTRLKAVLSVTTATAASTWVDFFTIPGVSLSQLCSLPTTIEFYSADRTILGIINRTGVVKGICSAGFKAGDVIYINGIYY